MGITLIVKLAGITFIVPWFSLSGLILIALGSVIAELCQFFRRLPFPSPPNSPLPPSFTDIHAQLSCKREMSNAKSPLFSHCESEPISLVKTRRANLPLLPFLLPFLSVGDAIAGLVSVRAYGAEKQVRAEGVKRVDRYMRTIVVVSISLRFVRSRAFNADPSFCSFNSSTTSTDGVTFDSTLSPPSSPPLWLPTSSTGLESEPL